MNSTAGLKCFENLDASAVSTLRCGGILKKVYYPESVAHLTEIAHIIASEGADYKIIGRLSNTLVSDGGYCGITVSTDCLRGIDVQGTEIYAGSGEILASVAALAKENLLGGLERLSGIPGSIGGAVCMNSGCFGAEIAQTVKKAYIFDFQTSSHTEVSADELAFSYRKSALRGSGKLLVGVCLGLKPADRYEMQNVARMCAEERKSKQPRLPSLGSVFKKVGDTSAGLFIEGSGLKGTKNGGMEISSVHANFIVNNGGGTAKEYIELAELAEKRVFENYGIKLEREIDIIGDGI